MKSKFQNIAVIGTGVIGTGWIIRFLAHNKKVTAYDLNFKLEKKLKIEVKRAWPFVSKLFNKKLNLKNLNFVTSLEKAVENADFVQEYASENYSLKIKLMRKIEIILKKIQLFLQVHLDYFNKICSKCKNSSRGLIGHPFNPVYLCPGVEIMPEKNTKKI